MQAVAGREAALQRVEEARLVLRAAERDNADLHARLQQAAAPSRHGHRQQHEPTARQLWAGPKGRSTAYGSLAASPVSRYQHGLYYAANGVHNCNDTSVTTVAADSCILDSGQ